MKQHNYNEILEVKTILETDITSAFRSIDPSYKNTDMWYQSQKTTFRSKKSKYFFTIPLFGTAFAAIFACIMIFSSSSNQNNQLAIKNSVENASFSIETNDIPPSTARTMKVVSVSGNEQPEERILSKIDRSIQASSRVQPEAFISINTDDALNALFE